MTDSTQSLRTILEQALLAEAAYAVLDSAVGATPTELASLLTQRPTPADPPFMRAAAAIYLATNFQVIQHQSNTPSGYSGTLFRRRVTQQGDPTSGFVLAFRGTEPRSRDAMNDYLADVQIALAGQASGQRYHMVQHWDGLVSGLLGGLDVATLSALQNSRINVTGHSLGGHLATWFASDRAGWLEHAFTFNAAGAAHVSEVSVGVGRVSNLLSDTYPDFAQSAGGLIGFKDRIFIEEDASEYSGPFPNHSIENLVGGIASRYLLSLIDPGVSDEVAISVMDALANVGGDSYERLASLLQVTFDVAPMTGETNGDATIFALITDFESAAGAPGHRDAGQLISLVDRSAGNLVQLASAAGEQGAAVRRALANGVAFAVVGAGTSPDQQPQYALENFSNEYLEDRAAYLGVLWKRNSGDVEFVPTVPHDLVYRDLGGSTETVIGNVPLLNIPASRQVVFGRSDAPNVVSGGNFNDRLFGGGAGDVINGGDRNDLLDGGGGNDILNNNT